MARRKKIEGPPERIDPRPIREIEREAFDRFTGGRNELGWRAWGRDPEDNAAVMVCETAGPVLAMGPTIRTTYVKITNRGMIWYEPRLRLADVV